MTDDALIDHVPTDAKDVLLINPSRSVLEATIERAADLPTDSTVRVLARESVYKALTDDFLLACELADLVEREVVRLRTSDDVGRNPVLVTDGAVVVRIAAGSHVEHVEDGDEAFVSEVRAAYEESWGAADPFDVRAPARSQIRESLLDHEELGEPVWEDFAALLDRADAVGGDLDEVTLAVLAAAKNGRQLYHLSKWGEDVGLASKATFSRMKKHLEETGVVETVRVPVQVGRPRQRLTLPDDLRESDVEALVEAAR